jgi:hypothetical protein
LPRPPRASGRCRTADNSTIFARASLYLFSLSLCMGK